MPSVKTILALSIFGFMGCGSATQARAHFPWLAVDEEGRAILFFGENPADREYHMPESIAAAKVQHRIDDTLKPLTDLAAVETDGFVGRRSKQKVAAKGQLQSSVVYGNYHGMKLTYSAQSFLESNPAPSAAKPTGNLDLEAVLSEKDGGVAAQIFWRGKPLPEAKVQLFCEEGHEEATATTDPQGRVHFSADEVEEGLNGLLVGRVDKVSSGELNGEAYTGEAHYLTVTFVRP